MPVILAIGFTVIVILKGDPTQLPCGEVGVTVYVAVKGAFVVLLMVALKDRVLAPEPFNGLNPVMDETVQLYLVLAGTIPFVTSTGVMTTGMPLQVEVNI
jgi:hypothetical protein